MQDLIDILYKEAVQIDAVQWIVLVLGVAEVLLAKRNSIWLYPAGIGASVLAIYGLFGAQLFAESLLHLYYFGMSVYGWWNWARKKNVPPVVVTFCSRQDWLITAGISVLGCALLYAMLVTFTPSTVPFWDAFVSATAWAGTWLLARRKVENWLVLNLSNAFAVPLLFYKNLPLFAALTIFLFVIACLGYIDWRKIARSSVPAS